MTRSQGERQVDSPRLRRAEYDRVSLPIESLPDPLTETYGKNGMQRGGGVQKSKTSESTLVGHGGEFIPSILRRRDEQRRYAHVEAMYMNMNVLRLILAAR